MPRANKDQVIIFKREYCRNVESRRKMMEDFEVEVETYEEMLPGKSIRSYATGERNIEGNYIMLKVVDKENDVEYYPVFSPTTVASMNHDQRIKIPKIKRIFVTENVGGGGGNGAGGGNNGNEDNKKLRILIIFARSMMILHSNEVKPLYGKFKYIYNLLEGHPFMHVKSSAVKDVNDAIRNYLLKDVNKNNENFQDLPEYIEYLRNNANGRRVRNVDFESLRVILRNDYPNEVIYF